VSATKTPTKALHLVSTLAMEYSAEVSSLQPTRPSGPDPSTDPVATILNACPATSGTCAIDGDEMGALPRFREVTPSVCCTSVITLYPETRTGLPGISTPLPTLTLTVIDPVEVPGPVAARNRRVAPAGTRIPFRSPSAVNPLPIRNGC